MSVDTLRAFGGIAALTAPLFLLVAIGYALSRFGHWPKVISDALTRFVFAVAVPALLFRLMSDVSHLPLVDHRLLIAYFGGCAITYVAARRFAAHAFAMDGVGQSVFGMGTIFSNNVLLGIPIAKVALGETSLPMVSLILVFNSFLLWTVVTVSIEWARNRDLSVRGITRTARDVVTNPIVAAILLGTGFGFTGWPLPAIADDTLALIAQAAVPMSLIVLGMGLAEFGVRQAWRQSVAIAILKMTLFPLAVLGVAWSLGLPTRETQVVVTMAAMPVGANVYLMARQFDALEGPVAASLVLSTVVAAVTTPLVIALLA
ncbi:MAG: AEC family transporter [Burkholderiales bacterium]|nr:AEC family transporter [Burkholderiales bacterium]